MSERCASGCYFGVCARQISTIKPKKAQADTIHAPPTPLPYCLPSGCLQNPNSCGMKHLAAAAALCTSSIDVRREKKKQTGRDFTTHFLLLTAAHHIRGQSRGHKKNFSHWVIYSSPPRYVANFAGVYWDWKSAFMRPHASQPLWNWNEQKEIKKEGVGATASWL